MRITLKTGLISAVAWIVIKLAFFWLNISANSITPTVLLNIFGLLSSITIGLFLQKRRDTEETNAMHDLKNAMSAGVPYAVIVSVFIYLFYGQINPEYYEHQLAENKTEIHKMVSDPVRLEKFKKEHPDAEVMYPDQIEKRLFKSAEQQSSAGFTSTLSMLALLILGTFYSLIITIILRKVVFRK